MNDYDILIRMGKARAPVETYDPCFPTYISYVPTCSSPTAPPPSCKHLSDLQQQETEELLNQFISLYPAFANTTNLQVVANNLSCLYPNHTCVGDPCTNARFFLLLAHYLTLLDNPALDTTSAVTSSSVGDVSISYDTSSFQGRSPFFLWLNKSPYGRQLINIMTLGGLPFVV